MVGKFKKKFSGSQGKKGQAAMEFLMTYGWAILIILVAIGALYFMGVFSPQVSEKCVPKLPFAECNVKFQPGAGAGHEVSERWPPQAIDANPVLKSIDIEGIGVCTPTFSSGACATSASPLGVALTSSGTKCVITCTWTPALAAGLITKSNYKGSMIMSYRKGGLDKDVVLDISGAVQ